MNNEYIVSILFVSLFSASLLGAAVLFRMRKKSSRPLARRNSDKGTARNADVSALRKAERLISEKNIIGAAEILEQIGQEREAINLLESFGSYLHAASILDRMGLPVRAAAVLEKHECFVEAVAFYRKANQHEMAVECAKRAALSNNWSKIHPEYLSLIEDYLGAARKFRDLENHPRALDQYRRATEQPASLDLVNESDFLYITSRTMDKVQLRAFSRLFQVETFRKKYFLHVIMQHDYEFARTILFSDPECFKQLLLDDLHGAHIPTAIISDFLISNEMTREAADFLKSRRDFAGAGRIYEQLDLFEEARLAYTESNLLSDAVRSEFLSQTPSLPRSSTTEDQNWRHLTLIAEIPYDESTPAPYQSSLHRKGARSPFEVQENYMKFFASGERIGNSGALELRLSLFRIMSGSVGELTSDGGIERQTRLLKRGDEFHLALDSAKTRYVATEDSHILVMDHGNAVLEPVS